MKSLKNVAVGDLVALCGESQHPEVQPYKPYEVILVKDSPYCKDDRLFYFMDEDGREWIEHTGEVPFLTNSCSAEWVIVDPREETIRKIQEKMREINDLLELLK